MLPRAESGSRQLAVVSGVAVSLAAALWASSLGAIDVDRMTDLGLISVLPTSFFVALGVLTVSFCLTLRGDSFRVGLALLHVAVLVFVLYGTPALVEQSGPRTESAWKMVGIIEHIARTGEVDPYIDHFFNWPSFFIAAAFITELGGVTNLLGLASWAPVFLNLLYLAPLLVIFRSGGMDERVVWLAAWFFYLTNWVGQDYLSPQGFNYFLFLVVVAIMLKWFHAPSPQGGRLRRIVDRLPIFRRTPEADSAGPATESPPTTLVPHARVAPWPQRASMVAIVLLIFAVIASGHQLTPFATIAFVAAGVVAGRFTTRGLPMVMLVIAATWITFMTVPFLAGHVEKVTSPLGAVGGNVSANLVERVQGNAEHMTVVFVRLGLTAAVWFLAVAGAIRAWRERNTVATFALLAASPFPLLALQEYGGELLMRAYFFSLPFAVFLAASLFHPTRRPASARTTGAIFLTSMVLVSGFFVARYGNEKMDYFTDGEVAATQRLYELAERDSILLAVTANVPWKHRDYATYDYEFLVNQPEWEPIAGSAANVNAVVRDAAKMLAARDAPEAYLIITRGQKTHLELLGLAPRGSGERLERAVMRSSAFRLVYGNDDAKIFRLTKRAADAA
jgi:hypothetical protein